MAEQNDIVDWIVQAGITCRGGFYPGNVPIVQEAIAVVHKKQIRDNRALFSVTVMVPSMLEGGNCEATAESIYNLLVEHGAVCTLEECRYDVKSDRYMQDVTAYWEQAVNPATEIEVKLNGSAQQNVTYCRSRQVYREDEENPGRYLPAGWEIQIRQVNAGPVPVDQSGFLLKVTVNGQTETFIGCWWTEVSLERTGAGTVLNRTCFSDTRTL